ncbi:MAG: response regulator [Chitinophagaceae bacterium]|nr:response regulator [Oligoflexus sp.]
MTLSSDDSKTRKQGSQSLKTCKHSLSALLVEDAPENQFLISKILGNCAIAVEIANDGAEGVRKALAGTFDFILMDMHMPVLDGYDATRSLRKLGYDRPIIALTADSLAEDHVRILGCGCDAHLTKPVDFRCLLETIEALLTNAANRHYVVDDIFQK